MTPPHTHEIYSSIFIARLVLLHNIVWYLVRTCTTCLYHTFLFFDIPIKVMYVGRSVLHHTHRNEMGTSLQFLQ